MTSSPVTSGCVCSFLATCTAVSVCEPPYVADHLSKALILGSAGSDSSERAARKLTLRLGKEALVRSFKRQRLHLCGQPFLERCVMGIALRLPDPEKNINGPLCTNMRALDNDAVVSSSSSESTKLKES